MNHKLKKLALFALILGLTLGGNGFEGKNANLSFQPQAWTNFQAASNVLGQPNFTTVTSGIALNKMNTPLRTAVDPMTGKIFVADYTNHRVLRFAAGSGMMNGASAEAVFGTTGTPGLSATQFNLPQGIAIDAGGRLWVGDRNNRRVLRFDNAALKANGAAADGVLGQPNFTSAIINNGGLSASSMYNPSSVFADTGGRLWVTDTQNNRVLRFDNAAAKANGGAANGVLGQPHFTTNTAGLTQSIMSNTYGVTIDLADRLYVADGPNNRVLIFNNAATLPNGAPASNVLGQPNFTSNTANNGGISASSLNFPFYPSYDPTTGSIYIGDYNNNRVLRFSDGVLTSASVSISGRVQTPDGRGLSNAYVYLTDQSGETLSAQTTLDGNYRFDEVPAGQTVIISVVSRRYQFMPQVVTVDKVLENLNITAESK